MKKNENIIFKGGIIPSPSNYKNLYVFRSPEATLPYTVSLNKDDMLEAYNIKEAYIYDQIYTPQIIPEFTTKGPINTITTNNGLILVILPNKSVIYDIRPPTYFDVDSNYSAIIPSSELDPTRTFYKTCIEYSPFTCYSKIYHRQEVKNENGEIEIKYLYPLQIPQYTNTHSIFASDFDLTTTKSNSTTGIYYKTVDGRFESISIEDHPITRYTDNNNTYLYQIEFTTIPNTAVYPELWCDTILLPYKPYYNLSNNTNTLSGPVTMIVNNSREIEIDNTNQNKTLYVAPSMIDVASFNFVDPAHIVDEKLYLSIT